MRTWLRQSGVLCLILALLCPGFSRAAMRCVGGAPCPMTGGACCQETPGAVPEAMSTPAAVRGPRAAGIRFRSTDRNAPGARCENVEPAQRVIVVPESPVSPAALLPPVAPLFLSDAGPPRPARLSPRPYVFHSSSAESRTASGLRAPPFAS
jgi:hypothetical protein